MLGAWTYNGMSYADPRGMAQRSARQQISQPVHLIPSRMSILNQPAHDRKLLVSCSAQQPSREVVPFTNLASFNPAISASSLSRTHKRGPKGRTQQLVHCRATKQEVARRQKEQQLQQQQQQKVLQVQPADSTVRVPILSGGGGGIFFWWEIGKCHSGAMSPFGQY